MISCFKVKECEGNNDQTLFLKNGGVLLEELIAFTNVRSNPIPHFSKGELEIATNYYERHQILWKDTHYELYKGSLRDRPIFVKKYNGNASNPYKDIVIGSQMSFHKNVLKLLGCCLETENPILVYEFGGTKNLGQCIFDTNVDHETLPWKCRLKIAIDLADAIAYLHTAFSTPVVLGSFSPAYIILDQNTVPKLTDFGFFVSVPDHGNLHAEVLPIGRIRYMAPEYAARGYLTEKGDVYNHGILLVELFCGKRITGLIREYKNILHDEKHFIEIFRNLVDQRITNEGIKEEHLSDFEALIIRCISWDGDKRPTMIEVAKELRRIYESFP